MKLWVCLPVYYDVKSFKEVRSRIQNNFAALSVFGINELTFVVADDSAGFDPEIGHLKDLNDTRIVTMPVNSGHQKAIVTALRAVVCDFQVNDLVLTMDSDGEDNPGDIPRLLEALIGSGDVATLVLAKRTSRQERLAFKLMYKLFKVFFKLLTGVRIQSGNFALQTAKNVERTIFRSSFDHCYSTSLVVLNPAPFYVSCARSKRYHGQSRMNNYSLVSHGIRMLMPFWERISTRFLLASASLFAITISFMLFSVTVLQSSFLAVLVVGLLGLLLSIVSLMISLLIFAIFSSFARNST